MVLIEAVILVLVFSIHIWCVFLVLFTLAWIINAVLLDSLIALETSVCGCFFIDSVLLCADDLQVVDVV